MFSALAKKVFNKTSKREFYSSIWQKDQDQVEREHNHALNALTEQSSTLTPEQVLNECYYDFLFGKLDKNRDSDDLSIYIAQQVKELIVRPQQLLENLPVLPTSLTKVLPHIRNNNFDTQELVDLLEQEPVVAAKVIELANSSHYNRSKKEIADLKSAFLMLGVQGLSEGVINGFIHRLVPQTNLYFKFYGQRIWQSSLMTGEITKALLTKAGHQDLVAEGYLLGLISNLGDIIIYQLMADAFNFVHPDCQPNSFLFRETLKQNAKRFSCILVRHWNFPNIMTNCLALQTQLESSKQSKANLQKYPLACYLFEARLLTKLKLQLEQGSMSKQDFISLSQQLSLSEPGKWLIEKALDQLKASNTL